MTGDGRPAPVVVMGVSAVGKSTVGLELARRLGSAFVDADDLHPEANRTKMRAGVPPIWKRLLNLRTRELVRSRTVVPSTTATEPATPS